jgi:putative transposase
VKTSLRKGAHAVFSIQFHIVFVTKYRCLGMGHGEVSSPTQLRKNAINLAIIDRLREVFTRVCEKRKCILVEFSGEDNHVHLLVDAHPDNNISQLISSLKSASSRIIRKEFEQHLKHFYWKKEDPSFWTDAYYIVSVGGAPLEIVKQYIQSTVVPKS